jgi:hypothetical protein
MPILHLHRLNRILCSSAVLALGSLTVAPAAYADTLTVCPSGCDFTAIQPAIDSASSGDTIQIFSGVYRSEEGPIAVITDKSLVLEGVGATVLDCPQGSCEVMVRLSCSQSHQIIIKGLTIQNTGSAFGGVNLTNHGCKLKLIDSAMFGTESGEGIVHQGRGTLTIKDSEVSHADGGIIISESKAFIINSTVTDSVGRFAPAAISNGGTLHLYHSTVSDNGIGESGSGIFNRGTLIVKHSSIVNNRSGEPGGAGGGLTNAGVAIIEDSLIARNIANAPFVGGGGISNRGKLTLIRSTVRGNFANRLGPSAGFGSAGFGGGIYNIGDVRLIGTLVTQNFASDDGGGVFNDGGTVLQTKTLIINNTPNDCVGC